VPQAWVETATSAHVDARTLSDSYGYQWWVDGRDYVMALGLGGQHIVIIPDRDLVVVFTAGLSGAQFDLPEHLATTYVIPAVISDEPLPPNPEAETRLAAAVTQAGMANTGLWLSWRVRVVRRQVAVRAMRWARRPRRYSFIAVMWPAAMVTTRLVPIRRSVGVVCRSSMTA